MKPPSGYRFFRDDALLDKRAKETRYCKRCNELYWIDEATKNSKIAEGYCQKCLNLFNSRIGLLEGDRPRAGCPIDSKEFIFTEHYHNYGGRGKAKATYDSYQTWKEMHEKWEKEQHFKAIEDYYKIVKIKTIEELKHKHKLLKQKEDFEKYGI